MFLLMRLLVLLVVVLVLVVVLLLLVVHACACRHRHCTISVVNGVREGLQRACDACQHHLNLNGCRCRCV